MFGCSSSRCSRLSSDGSSLSVKVEVINILSSIEENKALLETGEMWKFQQYKFISVRTLCWPPNHRKVEDWSEKQSLVSPAAK